MHFNAHALFPRHDHFFFVCLIALMRPSQPTVGTYDLPTLDFNSLTGIFVVYGGMLVLAFAYMAAAACARHVQDTLKR
jgi:hypothetical protein